MKKGGLIGIGAALAFMLSFVFSLVVFPLTSSAQSCGEQLHEEFKKAATAGDYELFIEKHSPCELAFVAVQRLAAPYLRARDWPGAIAVFDRYQGRFPAMQDRFAKIISMLNEAEEGLFVSNLGPEINTEEGEFHPVVSADGGKLYFGRDCGECGGEDIFVAEQRGDYWHKAQREKTLSSENNELPLGLSTGANTITIFGHYPGSLGRGDIFYAQKTGDTCWSGLQHYPAPLNSEYFESDAAPTADGKAVLFVSERPGAVGDFHRKGEFFHGSFSGNTDIYVYVETAGGGPEIINLGTTINTPFAEYTPFLHPDGKTLYFSSDGHYGLGGLDLFKSARLSENSWTEWSEPINLGKEINSTQNDWGYQISTAGDRAFFSAARPDSYGGDDIYSVQLPQKAKPAPVVAVSGRVTDPESRPLQALIKWNDLTMNMAAGVSESTPDSGEYFITLPVGRMYGYYAEKEGYLGRSENLDFSAIDKYTEYKLDIVLYPAQEAIDQEIAIRLNNIFFDFDKATLKKESYLELNRWVEILQKNQQISAEIHGHTCRIGTDQYNLSLSGKRAAAVLNYLVKQGIDKERLTAMGFGESKPIATNKTLDGRKQNRRVEIKLGRKK